MPRSSPGGEVEVRLHGRGGQGTVVASLVLARAAMIEGKSVQAFPEFGVERRGAPVTAFLRVGPEKIRVRSKVYRPDHVLVLDRQLIPLVELPADHGGWFVANTPAEPASLTSLPAAWRPATIDATKLARAHGLGSGALPVVNCPMAAAFARITGIVGLEALLQAIRETVPQKPDANAAAAEEAWGTVAAAPTWEQDALQRAFGGS